VLVAILHLVEKNLCTTNKQTIFLFISEHFVVLQITVSFDTFYLFFPSKNLFFSYYLVAPEVINKKGKI
jgi:hypothetical protein